MNQGTRIVVTLVVLLVLSTGIYWIVTGSSRATPASGTGATPATGSQTPAGETPGGAPATGRGAGTGTSGSGAGGSGAGGSGAGNGSRTATPPTGTSSDRSLSDGVRRPERSAEALGAMPAGASGATGSPDDAANRGSSRPSRDFSGKDDSLSSPSFTRVRPAGPIPSLANVPVGFTAVPERAAPPTIPSGSAGPAGGGSPAAAPDGASPTAPPAAAPPRRDPAPPAAPPATPAPTTPPARPAATPAGGNGEHVVKEGDTLTSIAEAWFGDGTKWTLIQAANPGLDPARLKIDQRIMLPPKGAARTAAPGSAPATTPTAPAASPSAAPTPGGTYTVREGDTLYSIAKALFGDGTRWDELYDANKATIGTDPKSLRTGMKLSMPR